MSELKNKIDFLAVVSVKNANPNGDPLSGNMPRVTNDGLGEISDVCIKRKIRNRWMDMGEPVFVQSDDKKTDGCKSLSERVKAAQQEMVRQGKHAGGYAPYGYELMYNGEIITGVDMMEEAKITGITPAVLIFNGMTEDCPPTIRLPCIFWEYCTGIRLSPSCRTITKTTMAPITARIMIAVTIFTGIFPLLKNLV